MENYIIVAGDENRVLEFQNSCKKAAGLSDEDRDCLCNKEECPVCDEANTFRLRKLVPPPNIKDGYDTETDEDQDWNTRNWGTPSDVQPGYWEEYKGSNSKLFYKKLGFRCDEHTPDKWMEKVARMYKDLIFLLCWADEDDLPSCGSIRYENGTLVKNTTFQGVEAWTKLIAYFPEIIQDAWLGDYKEYKEAADIVENKKRKLDENKGVNKKKK
jgi:hypothetical protein